MRTVRTHDVQVHQHTVYFFLGNHTGTDHFFGKFIEDCRHTVLHIHGGDIRIGSYLKIDRRQRHTVIRTNGRHIGHSGHTIDSTFQGSRHSFSHHIGIGSRITGRHRNGRRNNIGKLGNRQRGNSQQTQKNNHNRNDTGQNRASDEYFKHTAYLLFSTSSDNSNCLRTVSASTISGVITIPSLTCWTPS